MITKTSRGIDPTLDLATEIDNSSSFLVDLEMLEGLAQQLSVTPWNTFH